MFSPASLIVLATALVVGGVLLFYRPLADASWWRAMVTPLASIMGSGFLVCAPLLYANLGNYAVLAMAALLVLAYGVGSVIRFNIRYGEPTFSGTAPSPRDTEQHRLHAAHCHSSQGVDWAGTANVVEKASHLALIAAYCISVSYYLQLLAGFALKGWATEYPWTGKVLVTLILAGIGLMGMLRGLKGIERIERTVVGVNLAMIAALLAGLVQYNLSAASASAWQLQTLPVADDPVHLVRLVMGLLIVVQGFETSRFLGSEHPREERIRTIRLAQIVSSAIYLAFLALMALVMSNRGPGNDQGITAIVALSGQVAPILPLLLTITAIGSQFSAATADDAGCAGLLEAMLKEMLPKKGIYLLASGAAIGITWLTDVYQIISYASRAFALFYAMQCAVALLVLLRGDAGQRSPRFRQQIALFAGLGLFCLLVTIFGIPAE